MARILADAWYSKHQGTHATGRCPPPSGPPPGCWRIWTLETFQPSLVSTISTSMRNVSDRGAELAFVMASSTTPNTEPWGPEMDWTNTERTLPTLATLARFSASTFVGPKNRLTWSAKSPTA
jgi:hypothetical protein